MWPDVTVTICRAMGKTNVGRIWLPDTSVLDIIIVVIITNLEQKQKSA